MAIPTIPGTPLTAPASALPYVPTGYEAAQRGIDVKRRLAESMLAGRAPQAMRSPLEALAQAFEAYGGKHLEKQAEEAQTTLDAQRTADYQARAKELTDALAAPGADQTAIAARYAVDPVLGKTPLVEGLLKANEKKLENAGTFDAPINVTGADGKLHLRSYNKAGGYQDDPTGATLPEKIAQGPAGQLYGEYTGAVKGFMGDVGKETYLDKDGKVVLNQPLVQAKKDIAQAGKADQRTTVVLPAMETSYAKTLGEATAKSDGATLDAARTAPQTYQTGQRVKQLVASGQVFTGTAANARLTLAQALQTAGLKSDPRVAKTQELVSSLAQGTLNHVHSSGLGAGQGFTDKDREFVEQASSGNISLSPTAISHLADLSMKAARLSQAQGQAVFKRMSANPAAAAMVKGLDSELSAPLGDSSLDLTPAQRARDILRKRRGY